MSSRQLCHTFYSSFCYVTQNPSVILVARYRLFLAQNLCDTGIRGHKQSLANTALSTHPTRSWQKLLLEPTELQRSGKL